MTSALAVRRGSQTPRVSNFPPYDLSAAPEVIDLAESAGLVLDPWQRDILTHGLGLQTDGRYTANRVSVWVPRQNGKGAIIEALELAWLFLFNEEEIIHSAHQHRTSMKAYKRLEKLIRNTPDLYRRVGKNGFRHSNGEQQIELRNGHMLQYVTRSRTAVRGFSAKKLVWDEGQEVTQEQVAAVGPTTSAQYNWQHWFFGTPPDDEAAWCYNLREDGEEGVPRLAHFDWGADLDTRAPDFYERAKDLDLAYTTNPALGIRIEQDTVEDEMRPSGLGTKYPQERLGVWKPRAHGGGVIDTKLWARMIDPESKRAGDVALSLDVTPMLDHASISMYGPRADGLGHVQVVKYGAGIAWCVKALLELKAALDPVAIGVDGVAAVRALLDDMAAVGITPPEDEDHPQRGDLLIMDSNDVGTAVGQFIAAARAEGLRHIGQAELTVAVAGAKPRPLGDAIGWGRRQSDVDISPVCSATYARYTFHARIDKIGTSRVQVLSGSLMA